MAIKKSSQFLQNLKDVINQTIATQKSINTNARFNFIKQTTTPTPYKKISPTENPIKQGLDRVGNAVTYLGNAGQYAGNTLYDTGKGLVNQMVVQPAVKVNHNIATNPNVVKAGSQNSTKLRAAVLGAAPKAIFQEAIKPAVQGITGMTTKAFLSAFTAPQQIKTAAANLNPNNPIPYYLQARPQTTYNVPKALQGVIGSKTIDTLQKGYITAGEQTGQIWNQDIPVYKKVVGTAAAFANPVLETVGGFGMIKGGLNATDTLIQKAFGDNPEVLAAWQRMGKPNNGKELADNFHKASLQLHPDMKGGDSIAFQNMNHDYQLLKSTSVFEGSENLPNAATQPQALTKLADISARVNGPISQLGAAEPFVNPTIQYYPALTQKAGQTVPFPDENSVNVPISQQYLTPQVGLSVKEVGNQPDANKVTGKVIVPTNQENLPQLPPTLQRILSNIQEQHGSKDLFLSQWENINNSELPGDKTLAKGLKSDLKTIGMTPSQFYDNYSNSKVSLPTPVEDKFVPVDATKFKNLTDYLGVVLRTPKLDFILLPTPYKDAILDVYIKNWYTTNGIPFNNGTNKTDETNTINEPLAISTKQKILRDINTQRGLPSTDNDEAVNKVGTDIWNKAHNGELSATPIAPLTTAENNAIIGHTKTPYGIQLEQQNANVPAQSGQVIAQGTSPAESVIGSQVGSQEIQNAGTLGKTTTKPQVTPKLSLGVQQLAIDKKLTSGFSELPTYQKADFNNQKNTVLDLIKTDYPTAKEIAFGNIPPPQGIEPGIVFKAVESKALLDNDVETLGRLANSNLSEQTSKLGATIASYGYNDPESPVAAIKSVVKARETALTRKNINVPETVGKEVSTIKETIAKTPVQKNDWVGFVNSLNTLSPNNKLITAITSGQVTPSGLMAMSDADRHALLENLLGKDVATKANAEFESKLLLKQQQRGIITWAKKWGGLKPQTERGILSTVGKLDKALSPIDADNFYKDLVQQKLGVGVTPEETKQIISLSRNVSTAKENWLAEQPQRLASASTTPIAYRKPTEIQLKYGRSVRGFHNYLNGLKSSALPKNTNTLKLVGGTAKSIRSSLDNSFSLRQGAKVLYTHPGIWRKNYDKSWQVIADTFRGKDVMDEVMADIVSRDSYPNMVKDGIHFGLEEAFPEGLEEKIPVIRVPFKASDNAFTAQAYLNRADLYDLYTGLAKNTGIEKTTGIGIGNLVNSLTSRGDLGRLEPVASAIGDAFWSPRSIAANLNVLTAHMLDPKASPFVKKQAAINEIKIIGAIATIMLTANVIKKGSAEKNPISSDFGKIVNGKYHADISGGLAPYIILAARLIPTLWGKGATKSSTTGEITPLNSGKFGSMTGTDVLYNFLEGKLAPMTSVLWDIARGKDYLGNKLTVGGEISNLFMPMPISNYAEIKDDTSMARKIAAMILDGLGVSISYYGDTRTDMQKAQAALAKELEPTKVKVQDVYTRAQALKAAGDAAGAQKLVDGLTDSEYEIYKGIRSAQKTKETQALEEKVFPIYQQAQALKKAGDNAGAQMLVDGLTDDEYHAYTLIKNKFSK